MKKKAAASYSNIGTTSLLIIFLVLCMATFSALSLSTAKRDYDYSVKMSEHRLDYQRACNLAEQHIAEMISSRTPAANPEIHTGEFPDSETFSVSIGDDESQKLLVSVRYFPEDGVSYSIEEWRVASAEEWTADDHIQLVDIGDEL